MDQCEGNLIPAADQPILDENFHIRGDIPPATHCVANCKNASYFDGVCYPLVCPPDTERQLGRCKCDNMLTYSLAHACEPCQGNSRMYYNSLYGNIRVCQDEELFCGDVGYDFLTYGCQCGSDAFDPAVEQCVSVAVSEAYLSKTCPNNALIMQSGVPVCINAVKSGSGSGTACFAIGAILAIIIIAYSIASCVLARKQRQQ